MTVWTHRSRERTMKHNRGFTLVEVLVVVIILGVLATVVVPRLSTATAAARYSMLADDVRIARLQIVLFRGQHHGISPGYPGLVTTAAPTECAVVDHLTKSSTPAGEVADPGTDGFPYGPYMSRIPENPINGKATIHVIADNCAVPVAGDDSHGWIYQPSTCIFKADASGADEWGKAFIDY
jgi:general secretion pathway protein G